MANLKTEVDKLHIDKLVPVLVHLIKLSDVVKNDVIKKTVYEKLVAQVDNIDIGEFVLKLNIRQINQTLKRKTLIPLGLLKN